MVSQAPDAIDIVDFQFREHLRLNAFKNSAFTDPCNLVSVASRFGLIFIAGDLNEFQVVQVKDIEGCSKEVTEFKQRTVPLLSRTLHISVNCDSTKLAVVIIKDNCPHVLFYDVLSFLKQNIQIVNHTRLSQNPACKILQIDWNPALPDVFTAVKDDGTLLVYEFKGAPIELPAGAGATCFCWSPKGKQLAVGSRDGKITQYKIDLKAVKVTEAPPGFVSIISLCWVSSFQFFGVYNDQSGEQTSLICVDAPKAGATTYTNFDDVCYSNGDARPQQFYLIHQLHWNLLFVASSNSMEIAVLGMDASGKWTQWNLNDNCRAALPLGAKHEDTLPVGCAFNVGTTHFKVGDDIKQGPALFVLSDHGSLCMFNAINARAGAMDICSPLENVPDRSGEAQFVMKQRQDVPQQTQPVQQTQPQSQSQPQLPKPIASLGQFGTPQSAVITSAPQVSQAPVQVQVPKVPGLTINPVSIAPLQQQPQQQPPAVQSSLFGSSGMFKPALAQAVPPKTQAPLGFAQKPMFTPPVSAVAPQLAVAQKQPLIPNVPVAVSSFQTPPKDVPVTPSNVVPATPEKLPATPAKAPEKLPVTDETEAMIAGLVREECLTLEGELHALLERGAAVAGTGSMKIGTDAELAEMARKELDIEEFYSAIKENINTHDSEVYTLKQALLQTWACYEEARNRYASSKDPVTKVLLQSMPLDPASQHQRDEICRMMYYIESQLMQANQSLDEQWDNFQDTLMKSNKLRLPTMESVYQSMVQHNKTLQKQKYMLKHIAARIKATNRAKDKTLLNVNVTNLEGVGNLEEELGKLQIQHGGVPQTYNRLIERQSKLNYVKVKKLRDVLCNKEASRVCVSKPQLNNSTVQLTTLLATPLSPIEKKPIISLQTASGGFDKLINSTPKPKALVELKMAKVPVQTFSPTTQAFGFSSSTSSLSSSVSGTNLFGKQPSSTAFNFNALPAAAVTTVAAKPAPAPAIFSSASVMSVPGTGNTSSSSSTGTLSSTGDKGKGLFQSKASVLGANSGAGMFNVASVASIAPASKSTGMFGAAMPKSTKPALLATPTTPPVNVASMFGMSGAPAASAGSFLAGSKSADAIVTTVATGSQFFKAMTPATASSSPTVSVASVSSTTLSKGSGTGTSASAATIFSNSSSNASVAPTSTSLFGKSGNIFGSSAGTGTGSPANLFGTSAAGGTTTSMFGAPSRCVAGGPVPFGAATSTTGSMFGSSTGAAAPAPAPAPAPSATPASTPAPGKSMFGSPLFAAPVSSQAVVTAASSPSITAALLSSPKPAVVPTAAVGTSSTSSTKSLFGTPVATIASTVGTPAPPTSSIFGASASTTTTVTPAPTAATSTVTVASVAPLASTTSAFGSATPSIFSAAAATATAPAFGIALATTAPPAFGSSPPLFGIAASAPATVSVPVAATATNVFASAAAAFGASTTTPTPISAAPAVAPVTTAPPAFATTATTAFGATPVTTTVAAASPPAFGTPIPASTAVPVTAAAPAFGTGSIFGSSAFGGAGVTAAAPAFGTASPFGQSATSSAPAFAPSTTSTPFGGTSSAAFASSGNLFAQPGKFTSGGSIFGGGTPAAAAAATTTATPSAFGTSTSVFGNAPSAATPFGSTGTFGTASNSPFAQAATTPGQVQGQNQPQSSLFGTSSTFGATNTFGGAGAGAQSAAFASPPAGSASNNAFGGFGSLSVGDGAGAFGQSPAAAAPASNPFGAKTQEQKSLFGSTTGNLFATPASPAASSGNIFGARSAAAAPAFGASPGFGNTSFGQPSSFGNTSFGGAAAPTGAGAFSSGSQSVAQTGFGSPTFQKPAFGSSAVFGQQPAFGGNASFGSSPTFGGGATFGSPGKVFGGGAAEPAVTPFGGGAAAQSSTFGSIAQQNTVGFGNLAQQAATPSSTLPFSGGSSFTNWRN